MYDSPMYDPQLVYFVVFLVMTTLLGFFIYMWWTESHAPPEERCRPLTRKEKRTAFIGIAVLVATTFFVGFKFFSLV